ncbi:TetR/AcrR family transcriptional regulator [Janthinobacterium agaricidamnosum]|uniref:Bacterial regulatory s, tetR family protein n=1 Tax=Janthinobacterium agaricidamnosum NBRC 102515 = DSM 9628 TaxID=1349767 RepID=W0V959_9BURK|nr:TetR/AcrR family transcriptional regulator [Janthinobacterium agaricidamnosum]CDG84125.1 bacterial regulatory s, tetR family protein [Janthinobacterium agaricidamnosum NBRC 102515 = DSM 9628]
MDQKLNNIQERKLREAHARREHIINVVKALIKKGGAREVSIRKVAETAGFSTTVVYALFRDKATLIAQAMDKDLLELLRQMREASAGATDPWERIRLSGRAYVQFGMQHPDEYALVFMEQRPHAPADAAMVEHGNIEQDPYAYAHHLFQQLALAGEVRGDTQAIDTMTQIFWQALHGMVSLHIVMGADDDWIPHMEPDGYLATLLEVIIGGIKLRFR